MTEIQQNRWDQLIRRTANIVSPGSMVGDALNELFPVLDVETLNAELAFLSGWNLAMASSTLNASVTETNHHQLFNPAGSGQIIVLERVDIRSSALVFVRFLTTATALTDFTSNSLKRDTRAGVTAIPVGQVRDVQQVGGVSLVGVIVVRADVNEVIAEKKGLFTLAPGTGVTFATVSLNVATSINFWWRERVAEPAELNF